MPRLLPRLTRIIQAHPENNQIFPFDVRKHRPRRPKSLHRPTSPNPPFDPDAHPQSILLESENPIATPRKYFRHKTLPPRVFVPQNARHREGEYDKPRQMTEEERKWWSSPYLLIHELQALLLRLAPVRVDESEPATSYKPLPCIITPDGLEHPKFTSRRSIKSVHVICSRQAISMLLEAKRIAHLPTYLNLPPNLDEHVSHLLRLRLLQELEVLISQLKAKPKADIVANPPIRRLSKTEWSEIQENRIIPWEDAVAVINVPPIPSDAEPSMSSAPLPLDPDMKANAAQPVATLWPVSRDSPLPSNFQYRDVLPSAKVPLYDVLGLFPHVAQRAAFYQLLSRAHSVLDAATHNKTSSEASDAYILSSNSEIIKLGDIAALAMAMWRVYLYERDITRA
ncbi:hypothetical protein AN958_10236 [Leucoagaricus sp. SymC.cos]|nr:hypothetical protein AN958_10236 [Leucoagaricus sp. SymC.cos]